MMEEDEIDLVVESELEAMYTQSDEYMASMYRALAEIAVISAKAKEVLPQIKRMRRRLNRNMKRLCAAYDAALTPAGAGHGED